MEANHNAQKTLVDVVEHGGSHDVSIDVGTLVDQLGQQLGVNAAGKVPPRVADIQIVSNADLVKANDALKLLKALAWVLTMVALGLFALAIYLAEGWRREALRSGGFVFIAIGILVLVARTLAGSALVNHSPRPRPSSRQPAPPGASAPHCSTIRVGH